MIDMTPKTIFKCTKDFTHTGSFGKTKGHIFKFRKGSEYYYATANNIVFLHKAENGDSLPWLSAREFEQLVGEYLIDTKKTPA